MPGLQTLDEHVQSAQIRQFILEKKAVVDCPSRLPERSSLDEVKGFLKRNRFPDRETVSRYDTII